jgi:hypothetical protein
MLQGLQVRPACMRVRVPPVQDVILFLTPRGEDRSSKTRGLDRRSLCSAEVRIYSGPSLPERSMARPGAQFGELAGTDNFPPCWCRGTQESEAEVMSEHLMKITGANPRYVALDALINPMHAAKRWMPTHMRRHSIRSSPSSLLARKPSTTVPPPFFIHRTLVLLLPYPSRLLIYAHVST